MAEDELKMGDIVRLKSDNRFMMTIGLVKTQEKIARCFWFHAGELKDGLFPLATLKTTNSPVLHPTNDEFTVGSVVRLKSDIANQGLMTLAVFVNSKRVECLWFHEGEQKKGEVPLCVLTQGKPQDTKKQEGIQADERVGGRAAHNESDEWQSLVQNQQPLGEESPVPEEQPVSEENQMYQDNLVGPKSQPSEEEQAQESIPVQLDNKKRARKKLQGNNRKGRVVQNGKHTRGKAVIARKRHARKPALSTNQPQSLTNAVVIKKR